MKFRYLFALTLILLVLAMASTNPNKEDFIIWAKDIAIEKMAENYFFGDASSETINYMIGDILTFILDNHTETNNYILFFIHNFEVERI